MISYVIQFEVWNSSDVQGFSALLYAHDLHIRTVSSAKFPITSTRAFFLFHI
jgi:hypothetical protein